MADQNKALGQSVDEVTKSYSLNRGGLLSLQASAINAGQALAAGISPLRVASTESAQALGALVQSGIISFRTIAGWVPILGTVAAAFALVGSRYSTIQGNLRSFQIELDTIARGSNVSAKDLQGAVETLRDTGSSAAEAKQMIDAALSSAGPALNVAPLASQVAQLGRDISAVTGQKPVEAINSLVKAFAGGVPTLAAYAEGLRTLTAEEAAHYLAMFRSGDGQKAFQEIADRLANDMRGKYDQSLSGFTKAWNELAKAYDAVIDAGTKLIEKSGDQVNWEATGKNVAAAFFGGFSGASDAELAKVVAKIVDGLAGAKTAAADFGTAFAREFASHFSIEDILKTLGQDIGSGLARAVNDPLITAEFTKWAVDLGTATAIAFVKAFWDQAKPDLSGIPDLTAPAPPSASAQIPPSGAAQLPPFSAFPLAAMPTMLGAQPSFDLPSSAETNHNTDATRDNTDALKPLPQKLDDIINFLKSPLRRSSADELINQQGGVPGLQQASFVGDIGSWAMGRWATSSATIPNALWHAYQATPEELTPNSPAAQQKQSDVWNQWFGWTGQQDNPQLSSGLMGWVNAANDNTRKVTAQTTSLDLNNQAMAELTNVIRGLPEALGTALATAIAPLLSQAGSGAGGMLRRVSTGGDEVIGQGGGTSTDAALALIAQYESGGQNIPNYMFDRGHTASGPWQITNSTWNRYATGLGIQRLNFPTTAMDMPVGDQHSVASAIYGAEGFTPWTGTASRPINTRLAAAIGGGGLGGQLQLGQTGAQISGLDKANEQLERNTKLASENGAEVQRLTAYWGAWDASIAANATAGEADRRGWEAYNATLKIQNAESSKAVEETNRRAAAQANIAGLTKGSIEDVIRATAAEQARIQVQERGGDAAKIQAANQTLQAAAAIQVAALQSKAAEAQIANEQKIAEASANGTAAMKEAQIQTEAAARTQEALNQANASGNETLREQANNLRSVVAEQLKQREVAREQTQANLSAEQTRQQTELLKVQLQNVSQSSDEIQKQVILARERQDEETKYSQLTGKDLENLRASTSAYADMVVKLGDARAQQERFNEEIRSIADTISNTIGTALDNVLSGQKIQSWGVIFQTMLRQIANTILQTEFVKPLIGTLLGGISPQLAQQFGTLGGGGGLAGGALTGSGSILGSIFDIGGKVGTVNSLTGGGLTESLGLGGIGSGITGGINSIGSSLFGLANPALQGPTLTGATLGSVGSLGGISLTGLLGGIGIAGGAAMLLRQLGVFGPKPSTLASGNVLSLGTGGVGGFSSSGNTQNDQTVQQISSTLSGFLGQLKQLTGGTIEGALNIVATTKGIQTHYSGPLGNISATFATAAEAIAAFEKAFLQNVQGISDTMRTVLANVSDPQQLEAAVNFANAYDKVGTAFDSLFASIEESTKQAGPYSKILDQINAQYEALKTSAQQYGLSLDPIVQSYGAARDRLVMDFNKNIADALAALTDPFAQTLDAEVSAGQQRVADAKAINADIANIEKFNQANLEKIALAAATTLGNITQHLGGFITTLGDSFEGLFKNVETQMSTLFTSSAGLSQLSGTDAFSQAFNSIITQAEAATQAAVATFADPNILKAAVDAIQGVQKSALDRLAVDFEAGITDLATSATDPLQEAITKEVIAGKQRVTIAQAIGADLDQVAKFNEDNLLRVAEASKQSVNGIVSVQDAINSATTTLSGTITSVVASTVGPFKAALDNLNSGFGALITQIDKMGGATADLTPVLQAYADQIDKLRGSFNDQIQQGILSITDPVQAALNTELAAGRARVKDAQAIGADMDQVYTFNALNLKKVFEGTQSAGAAAASIDDLNTAIASVVPSLKGPFEQALDALNAVFARIAESTEATNAYADALSKLKDTFNTQIDQLTLAITDPVQAAINVEIDAGRQRIKDAISVGADLAKVDEYNTLSLTKVFDALQNASNASINFANSLATLQDALNQLKSGTLAGKRPVDQLNQDIEDFKKALAAAKLEPTTENVQKATQTGLGAVQYSQQIYGNAPRTANVREVVSAGLTELDTSVQQMADAAKGAAPNLTEQLQKQVDTGKTTLDAMQAISDAEFKRTGIHDVILEAEIDAGRKLTAGWASQIEAGDEITQTQVDRAKFNNGLFQQERDIGDRILSNLKSIEGSTSDQAGSATDSAKNASQASADLRNQLKSQIAAGNLIIGSMQSIADSEFQRTGVHDTVLETDISSARQTIANWQGQIDSSADITQADIDRAKYNNATFTLEKEIGDQKLANLGDSADATKDVSNVGKSSFDLATEQLKIQRQINQDANDVLRAIIDEEVKIANKVIAAQQSAADAFVAAIKLWQASLDVAKPAPTPVAAAPPPPPAQPMPDYEGFRARASAYANSYSYSQNPAGLDTYWLAGEYGNDPVAAYAKYGAPTAFAEGTNYAPPGWALIGERGPELMRMRGGEQILPHGMNVGAPANDDVIAELKALQEHIVALHRQIQGGQRQANRDARVIANETATVGRKINVGAPPRRNVA